MSTSYISLLTGSYQNNMIPVAQRGHLLSVLNWSSYRRPSRKPTPVFAPDVPLLSTHLHWHTSRGGRRDLPLASLNWCLLMMMRSGEKREGLGGEWSACCTWGLYWCKKCMKLGLYPSLGTYLIHGGSSHLTSSALSRHLLSPLPQTSKLPQHSIFFPPMDFAGIAWI